MRKAILYGLTLALLIFFLKMIEYKFFVRELRVEIYIGIIAIMFTVLGVWAGLKVTRSKKVIVTLPQTAFQLNEANLR